MISVPDGQTSETPEPSVTGEAPVLCHRQETSPSPRAMAANQEVQSGPEERERDFWLALESSEVGVRRLCPSPSSSPEISPPALSLREPTLSSLLEEIMATKRALQALSESLTDIRVELSKLEDEIAKVKMRMEKEEPRPDQVGDHGRSGAAKGEPASPAAQKPLGWEDELASSPKPRLGKVLLWQTSRAAPAVGEQMEEVHIVRPKEPVPGQGRRKPKAPKAALRPTRKEVNLHILQDTGLSKQKEKENQQGPEGSSSIVSVSGIVLATENGLKKSDKAITEAALGELTTALQEGKADMKDKVSEIVDGVYFQLSCIPAGNARRAALNVVISLAGEYSGDVVSSLLKFSLPCDSHVSEMWKSLCTIPETSTKVMWHLLRELKQRPRFQDSGGGGGGSSSNGGSGSSRDGDWLVPLAAMRALGEMFKIFTCVAAMRGFYPLVVLVLLTHIHFLVSLPGCNHHNTPTGRKQTSQHNTPLITGQVRFAVEALKTLLVQDRNEMALLWMERMGCWDLLSSAEGYLEGILLMARVLVTHTRHHVTGLLAEVIPKLRAEDEERTLTARALFAGFLYSKSATQLLHQESILAKLQEWQTDSRPTVRWLSLHGFGNMALHRQKVKQLKAMVSMILEGLKEPQERPVREVLKVLGNILSHHQGRMDVSWMCILIAEKLQPLLADERDQVRSSAIGLFGKLLRGLSLRHKSRMQEQVLKNMVPLLLHLHDNSQEVVEHCEWTLARCNDFLGWKLLEEIIILAHYDSQQALDKICKRLVQRYPGRTPAFLSDSMNYLKSPKAPLRRAASMIIGFLVFHMDTRNVSAEDLTSLLSGLGHLVHDPEATISNAASVSILQVRQAERNPPIPPLLRALRRVLCCLPSWEREKPQFEDSPFKRKQCLEVSEELAGFSC
ncbi:maestro heat-like repeat-containing protein family member 6 [Hemicordylus capensis]|uniref:maestro heat-like repeat-containing protein family member 6 n=1 Tax=Hemicordylus capensis TaxID=884348 RepID=UPI002302EC09|nr:maestro heat-like repeat-containing protein family member 6 [Hemicordylus capensis]